MNQIKLSNLANIDHLLPEKLPRAHAVLAPIGAQHLVHHLVRLHHAHRAQHLVQRGQKISNHFWPHLSAITCDLLKRFSQLETEIGYNISGHLHTDLLDNASGHQTLSLHGEVVFSSWFYCHQRLALVPKLSECLWYIWWMCGRGHLNNEHVS